MNAIWPVVCHDTLQACSHEVLGSRMHSVLSQVETSPSQLKQSPLPITTSQIQPPRPDNNPPTRPQPIVRPILGCVDTSWFTVGCGVTVQHQQMLSHLDTLDCHAITGCLILHRLSLVCILHISLMRDKYAWARDGFCRQSISWSIQVVVAHILSVGMITLEG